MADYVVTKTTALAHDEDDGEVKKKTRAPSNRKMTTKQTTTTTTKLARNRITLSASELVENNECTFQGNMPDPDNCQSKFL